MKYINFNGFHHILEWFFNESSNALKNFQQTRFVAIFMPVLYAEMMTLSVSCIYLRS